MISPLNQFKYFCVLTVAIVIVEGSTPRAVLKNDLSGSRCIAGSFLDTKNRDGKEVKFPLKEDVRVKSSFIYKAHEILCNQLDQFFQLEYINLGSYLSYMSQTDKIYFDEYGRVITSYRKVWEIVWKQYNETLCENYAFAQYDNDKMALCSVARFLSHQPEVKNRKTLMKRMGDALRYKCHPCTPYKGGQHMTTINPHADYISPDKVEEICILCTGQVDEHGHINISNITKYSTTSPTFHNSFTDAATQASSVKLGSLSCHIQNEIRRGIVPCRGVNLGGWLVSDYWINPNDTIWTGVNRMAAEHGEMAVMKDIGHVVGDEKFRTHWENFITEKDIKEIASFGLNSVRVPIGYWIIGYDDNDPSNGQEWKTFAPGGLAYLDRLINNWALKHNLTVLISIHAAKGSQNGEQHSSPSDYKKVYWDSYPENIANTVEVARFLADRYKNSPAFLGLDLLNSPGEVNPDKLKAYYVQAHSIIRATGNTCILSASALLSEQRPGAPNYWDSMFPPSQYFNAWHDFHLYLIWGFEDKGTDWLMNDGVATIRDTVNGWNGNWLLIGEWSLASSATFTDSQLTLYGKTMFEALKEAHSGWAYWTWKQGDGGPRGNGGGGWCMRCLLRDGIINSSMWS